MKFSFLLIPFYFLFSLQLFAQNKKNFEGTVSFDVNISGGGSEMEMAKAFMPSGYVYSIKGENVHLKTVGGMTQMMGTIVFNEKLNQSFMVNDAQKMVFVFKEETAAETGEHVDKVPQIKKGTEPRQIAGYNCEHYIISLPEEEGGITEIWVSEELKIKMPQGSSRGLPVNEQIAQAIKGFPLAMRVDAQGLLIHMEAKEVKREKINDSLFEMPKGYVVKDFDPAMFSPGGVE